MKRQAIIKELLNERFISNQEALIKLLQSRNIKATQATLSRDFAEMGVIKSFFEGEIRYVINSHESGKQIAKLVGLEIISITNNESIIIIRTLAGRAQGVAHYIDRLNKEDILGTIAGDDTVMVIPKSIKTISNTLEIIKQLLIEN
jgi:transcriptional regulator of arginine metabolism